MDTLYTNALPKNSSNDDAETRMYAIKSIREIIKTLGLDNIVNIEKTIETIFAGLNDYNVDRRGDIGSWIRQESIIGFKEMLVADKELKYITVFIIVIHRKKMLLK